MAAFCGHHEAAASCFHKEASCGHGVAAFFGHEAAFWGRCAATSDRLSVIYLHGPLTYYCGSAGGRAYACPGLPRGFLVDQQEQGT